MLKKLLKQNFAREATADHILLTLLTMAQSLPTFHLTYSDLDDAIALVTKTLTDLPTGPVFMPKLPEAEPIVGEDVHQDPGQPLVQRKGATVINIDGEAFGVSADLRRIIHLDEGGLRLWSLLEQPTSETEAADILAIAFPDASAAGIQSDIARMFAKFRQSGLVTPASRLL